jgi:hypothetical protein
MRYGIIFEIFDVMRHTLRCVIVYWFFWLLIEFTLVLVLEFSSVKIRNRGGVRGNDGIGTSSKVSDMLDV